MFGIHGQYKVHEKVDKLIEAIHWMVSEYDPEPPAVIAGYCYYGIKPEVGELSLKFANFLNQTFPNLDSPLLLPMDDTLTFDWGLHGNRKFLVIVDETSFEIMELPYDPETKTYGKYQVFPFPESEWPELENLLNNSRV